MSDPIVSVTVTPKPIDSRCKYWAKIVRADELPTPSEVSGAGDLPGEYLRVGEEVELFTGDYLVEGEANHHRRQRGWEYWVSTCVVVDGVPQCIRLEEFDGKGVKSALREAGERDLLRGAGKHAAVVRAIWAVSLGVLTLEALT